MDTWYDMDIAPKGSLAIRLKLQSGRIVDAMWVDQDPCIDVNKRLPILSGWWEPMYSEEEAPIPRGDHPVGWQDRGHGLTTPTQTS